MKQLLGVLAVVVASVGCQAAPGQTLAAPSASGALSADANAVKPEIDPTWANGVVVNMIGPHVIVGARESQPELYAHAEELYLVVFPQATVPAPNAGPITLPFGYRPQCNPCFHPGLPAPFVYHDHVITGAPGHGNDGTAGEFKAPWKIIIVKDEGGICQWPELPSPDERECRGGGRARGAGHSESTESDRGESVRD